MPGSDEGDKQPNVPPSPDPITKALADLTQQMASLFTRLEALESWPPVSGIDIRDTQSKEVSAHADFHGWLETY